RPQPTLTWLINDKHIEDHTILKNDGKVIISKISIGGAERSWLNTSIRCQATNTNLLSPHERMARVEMRLRPTSVAITNKPGQMSADVEMTIVCVSHGSRPPAQITWFRENRKFTRGKHTEFTNETTTVSRLHMLPQPEDDGAVIRCRADNPVLRIALEDSFRMNRPVLTMALGSTLNANDIKEGDDVYFECNIKANPRENRISWYHNDQQVSQNMSSGVFISTKSLVLQRVTKQDGGLYTCRAANDMGESSSQAAYLRVHELRYRAASERDYGALLCRATNSVGQQKRPCVFQIVPADLMVWLNISWSDVETLGEDEDLAVTARNSKGASEPVLLRDLTFRDSAKRAESTARAESKFPAAAALAGLAAILTAAGAIIALVLRSSSSKRPSQSVVQVDAQGRRYLIAYPADKPETKPDILNPKPDATKITEGIQTMTSVNNNIKLVIVNSIKCQQLVNFIVLRVKLPYRFCYEI
ncbi:Uncharacterized protein OBRU01_02781, partial [Operophtera brumata]